LKKLEAIFRHKVFKMLLAQGKITRELIAMLSKWRHLTHQPVTAAKLLPLPRSGQPCASFLFPLNP
jgi:hypothetical protein